MNLNQSLVEYKLLLVLAVAVHGTHTFNMRRKMANGDTTLNTNSIKKFKEVGFCLLFFIFSFIFSLGITLPFSNILSGHGGITTPSTVLIGFVSWMIVISAQFYVDKKLINTPKSQRFNPLILLMTVAISVVIILIFNGFPSSRTISEGYSEFYSLTTWEHVTHVIFSVICQPVEEELLWRGFIVGVVVKYIPISFFKYTLILIQSIAFGMMHTGLTFNMSDTPVFILAGLVLSTVFVLTKNLAYPIIGHSIANLYIILTTGF